MPKKRAIDVVYSALRDGPKFACQIDLPKSAKSFRNWYKAGGLSRSSRSYRLRNITTYGYAIPEQAGKTLTWKHGERTYTDTFVLCPEEQMIKQKQQKSLPYLQKAICNILDKHGALFSDEIYLHLNEENLPDKTRSLDMVRGIIGRMIKRGQLHRFDKRHGGWMFQKGYLLTLPGREEEINKRLEDPDTTVLTRWESALLNKVRNGVWMARDLRTELGIEESLLSFIARKLGQEAPYKVSSKGHGKQYHIEVEAINKSLAGRGLIPWLRWVNLFGNTVLYDGERVPENELVKFLKKQGYWLSEEGKRRNIVGKTWEEYVSNFFDLCDQNNEWQLRVLEHRANWRGWSRREFDHVYICQLGPKELNLVLYLIFECKSSIVQATDVEYFLESALKESEFSRPGGLKSNVILALVTGKSADRTALGKAAKLGIRIIVHTSVEDVINRLTGERKTFYKVVNDVLKETTI